MLGGISVGKTADANKAIKMKLNILNWFKDKDDDAVDDCNKDLNRDCYVF
jgi:hypothetical protein